MVALRAFTGLAFLGSKCLSPTRSTNGGVIALETVRHSGLSTHPWQVQRTHPSLIMYRWSCASRRENFRAMTALRPHSIPPIHFTAK